MLFWSPSWLFSSWLIFFNITLVLFDSFPTIWYVKLFQALNMYFLPQTWEQHFSSSNDCRAPTTVLCKSHLSFSCSSSKYLLVLRQVYLSSGLSDDLFSHYFLPLTYMEVHKTQVLQLSQVGPNYLSFRFRGQFCCKSCPMWFSFCSLFALFFMCKNQTITVFSDSSSLSFWKLCQLQFSCIKIYDILSINYTRINLIVLTQKIFGWNFCSLVNTVKKSYLPQS